LYKPVKVSENNLTRDFLLLDLEYPGFEVSPEPSFQDREFGFNQEPFTIPDEVKIVGHLLSIFPPDIRGTLMDPSWDDRVCLQGFADKPVHFLGIITSVHDIALRFMEFMTFFQKRECMSGIMDSAFRYYESDDNLLTDIDNNRGFQEMFSDLSGSFRVIMTTISAGKSG
jgi:hypothetical protein